MMTNTLFAFLKRIFSRIFEVGEKTRGRPLYVLLISVWFGIVAGLGEAALEGVLDFFRPGPMTSVWLQLLWVAPFISLLFYMTGGIVLALAARVFKRIPISALAIFGFSLVAFSGWLWIGLLWHIHRYAIYLLALGLAVISTHWFLNHHDVAFRFIRRSLPLVIAAWVLSYIGVQGGLWLSEVRAESSLPQAAEDAPNIVMVVVDTLRADHLSGYGYERSTSPNIDEIAREGVLFEAAFSTAPYTAPSHASLFTGRYANEHGAQWIGDKPKLDGRFPTIAEALKERGYRTAGFSANVFWVTRENGLGRGFLHFEDYFGSIGDMLFRAHVGRKFEDTIMRVIGFENIAGRKRAADVNKSALRWMTGNDSKPFFAFLNYIDVHDPYFPPQPYRSMFSEIENPGGLINSHTNRITPELTPEELQSEIAAYDGAIAYVDGQIADLHSSIQEFDSKRDLLFIITSDHGEAFGEHGAFVHANSVYREEIHVPLIIWYSGHTQEGLRISTPVSNASLPATIMDILGEGNQSMFPIPSLVNLWETPGVHIDWPLPLSEMERWSAMPNVSPSHHGSMKSLVSEDTHYIEHTTMGTELYDWNSDPLEVRDLSGSSEGQAIINRFKNSLSTVLVRKP